MLMIRKAVLVLGAVVAVSLVAVSLQTAHGEQDNVQISITSKDNIFASMSFDGENIWVEIQGITVRKRFEDVESAIDYIGAKYENRTNALLTNDQYLKNRLDRFKAEAKRKFGKLSERDQELAEKHKELEKDHNDLAHSFHTFVNSVRRKLGRLKFKIGFLYFGFSMAVLGVSAVVLFAPELAPSKKEALKERVEELEKKLEEAQNKAAE